jgi:hypothetical protein
MKTAGPVAKPYQGRPQKARKARIKVDLWCELHGAKDRAVGHIRNLTIDGCRILSPSAFPIRETLSLVLAGSAAEPDLHLKAQLRWLALNPEEGPFELGCRFVHSADSARQVERMLKGVMKGGGSSDGRRTPTYEKFGGGLEAVRTPGAPTAKELRRVFAAEGLDRLLKPGPSAPRP